MCMNSLVDFIKSLDRKSRIVSQLPSGNMETTPDRDEFTVGWICALPLELAAARAMLDLTYPSMAPANPKDTKEPVSIGFFSKTDGKTSSLIPSGFERNLRVRLR